MRWSIRAACVAALLMLPACAPVDALNATVSTDGVSVFPDLRYGPGPRQALDLYRPQTAPGPLPVVVFFYGGSWTTGDRADYLFVAAALAKRGILVAVPDYRLYPQAGYPAFLHDAADAVAYVRRVAPSWGGDPRRVVVVGHSAGAYIAAMVALDPELMAEAGDRRDALAGFVGIAGPYDFLPIHDLAVRVVFGAQANEPLTQPISYADGRNPPTLLLDGDADTTVEPRNTTALAARIRRSGGPVIVNTYPGVGHIGIITSFAPLFRDRAPALDDVARFVLQAPPSPSAAGS